jgi:hypothetical protein
VCLRTDLETTLCFTCREPNFGFSITETSSFNEVPCPISAVLSRELGLASRLPTILFMWHKRPFPPEVSSSRNLIRFSWSPEGGLRFVSEAATCSLLVCAVTASYCPCSYCHLLSVQLLPVTLRPVTASYCPSSYCTLGRTLAPDAVRLCLGRNL